MATLSKPKEKKTRKLNGKTYADKQAANEQPQSFNVEDEGDELTSDISEDDICFLDEYAPPAKAPDNAPAKAPAKPKGDGWTPVPHSNQVRCPHCEFTGDVWNKAKHTENKHPQEWARLSEEAAALFRRCDLCGKYGCSGECDDIS